MAGVTRINNAFQETCTVLMTRNSSTLGCVATKSEARMQEDIATYTALKEDDIITLLSESLNVNVFWYLYYKYEGWCSKQDVLLRSHV